MPAYTCRTEGMTLGRSEAKAAEHLLRNPTHRVIERHIATTELKLTNRVLDALLKKAKSREPVQPSTQLSRVLDAILREEEEL